MSDDFPKDWFGLRSFVGRTAARTIAGKDLWLRKNRFGAEAKNRGGKLEVKPANPQAYDGYYTLGTLNGTLHVLGSLNPYGLYYDRGDFVVDTGFALFSGFSLFYQGNGWGGTPVLFPQASIKDFNNKDSGQYLVIMYRTYNGKNFEAVWQVPWASPYIGPLTDSEYTQSFAVGGAYILAGKPRAYRNLSGGLITYQFGQYLMTFVVDKGDGAPYMTFGLTRPYQLGYEFEPNPAGQKDIIASARYMRPQYSQDGMPHPIDITQTIGIELQFSHDYGDTWTIASSATILQEFYDTVCTLPDDYTVAAQLFNQAVEYFDIACAPINAHQSICMALVPYIKVIGSTKTVWGKVKLGIVDSAANTVIETAVLFDEYITKADTFFGGIVAVKGGAVFITRPLVQDDPRDDVRYCHFTTDGITWSTSPAMPFPTWLMGATTALDENTLWCPMWDGQYSIYVSKDHGDTWARKGLITDKAPAPIKIENAYSLVNFRLITQLRNNNASANPTPGVPWASNANITPPPG